MADDSKKYHTVLFPTHEATNLSHVFHVQSKPVALRAFNIPAGVAVILEMGVHVDCANVWGPYRSGCCSALESVELTDRRNVVVLGVSGMYRMYVSDPGTLGYDDLIVTQDTVEIFSPDPKPCGCT